jgi:hypothetical protein
MQAADLEALRPAVGKADSYLETSASFFEDSTVLDLQESVGILQGFCQMMRDPEHSATFVPGKAVQTLADTPTRLSIQTLQRFIRQDESRTSQKYNKQHNSLPFALGKDAYRVIEQVWAQPKVIAALLNRTIRHAI